MVQLTREENDLIEKKKRGIIEPQNMSTKELLNTLNRYDSKRNRGKLSEIELEKIAKTQNISKNESNQTISLLKSESSALENNFMKHFNNNNTNDDTYDDKKEVK